MHWDGCDVELSGLRVCKMLGADSKWMFFTKMIQTGSYY